MAIRRLFWLVILVGFVPGLSAAEPLLEYQVKAVCVLNAARFITWPTAAFASADAPLVIGILGENPFGSTLDAVVKGETVHRRQIVVRRVGHGEAAKVHILFISQSERGNLSEVLQAIGGASVVTISEIDRFTQSGGMLGLALADGRIRFNINADAAQRAQLKIDSQFLLLARRSR